MSLPCPDRELGLLLLAARTGAAGGERGAFERNLAEPFDGGRLLALAIEQEIHPLLRRAMAGRSPVAGSPWLEALERACLDSFARNVLLRAELVRVNGILGGEEIPVFSLKGPAFAEGIYGGLELRTSGDLDLWLHKRDAPRAVEKLEESGYRICLPLGSVPVRQYLSFENALNMVNESGRVPVFVDLHWDMARPEHMVAADLTGIWERGFLQPSLEGAPPLLAPEDHLLFLAMHGYRHQWDRLKLLCDIDALIRRAGDAIDWKALAQRARSWAIEDIVERALRLSAALLETPLPPAASVCLAGSYWSSDPLNDPVRFRESSLRSRAEISTAGAWLARLAGRRGIAHRARQLVGSFHPNSMEFIALQGSGRYTWIPWIFRPLRIAGKVAGQALGSSRERGHQGKP